MKLSVSILASKDRKESINKINNTNTNYLHIDVMDGIFVENTSFPIEEIKQSSLISNKPLDVHLMVTNPIDYINHLNLDNIEYIAFHIELKDNIKEIINHIKSINKKVGISINPNTNINELLPYINDIDMILIMSVVPGKGGQKFMPEVLTKIDIIKQHNKNITIEIDGGINEDTIKQLHDIDIVVVGSFITNYDNYQEQIDKLNLGAVEKLSN